MGKLDPGAAGCLVWGVSGLLLVHGCWCWVLAWLAVRSRTGTSLLWVQLSPWTLLIDTCPSHCWLLNSGAPVIGTNWRVGWWAQCVYRLKGGGGGGGLVTQSCLTLVTPWPVPARLLCPWNFPGKNIRVGCHFLLQRIFLTQELNPGLLHCRQILYWLSYELLG